MPRARMPSARRHACQCGRNARGSKGLPSVFTKTKVSVLTRIGSMERRTCMVFREQVHGALGPPGLRGAVLVEVAGPDDCEPRAVEIRRCSSGGLPASDGRIPVQKSVCKGWYGGCGLTRSPSFA